MINPKIESLMDDFVRDNPGFARMEKDGAFSALCAKYMFFSNPMLTPFTEEQFACCIPDGSRDGGIDAMFVDPDPEMKRVVVFQCKYYSETNGLNERAVRRELDKLMKTIRALRHGDRHSFNPKVREAFDLAHDDFESMAEVSYLIVFATSWDPSSAEKKRQLVRLCREYCNDRFEVKICFGSDLLEIAESFGNAEDFVNKGELRLFGKASALKYLDSTVVNVSAESLGRLAKKERALLGLNLRYHVFERAIDKSVDRGIGETIASHPDDFWFFNNGIVIVCSSYSVRRNELCLHKFSIVNGGQTTHNIRKFFATEQGLPKDFPVLCKVVRSRGRTRKAKEDFCARIAECTNSQKPIKTSDLKANLSEHKRLEARLNRVGVLYLRKAGMPKRATVPRHLIVNMDRLAKIGLSGILLAPGSSRSGFQIAYDNALCYEAIFRRQVAPQVFADLLTLSRRYQQFMYKMRQLRRRDVWFDETEHALINNAETFVLAAISFLRKIEEGALKISEYKSARKANDQEELRKTMSWMSGVESIFAHRDRDDDKRFDVLFREICKTLFKSFRACRKELGKTIQPSNFFKRDDNFHSYVTDEVWKRFRLPTSALRLAYERSVK